MIIASLHFYPLNEMEMTIAPKIESRVSSPTSEAFCETMRQLASGATILTADSNTAGSSNEWIEITVTPVTSLPLKPAMILVRIGDNACLPASALRSNRRTRL